MFKDHELGVFCCSHVVHEGQAILYVSHDGDGDWQFLCGETGHGVDQGHLSHLGHLLDLDPTIQELADLDLGWEAERSAIDAPWVRTKRADQDA
jgi:hypothetical protein